MDQHLRDLERKALGGDEEAANQLDRAICRIEGHCWRDLIPCPPKFLKVRLCQQCLTTVGTRFWTIKPPDIFTVSGGPHTALSGVPVHAVTGLEPDSNTGWTGTFTTACKRRIKHRFRDALTSCNSTVTCKQCESRGYANYMAEAKLQARDIYHAVITLQESWHGTRKMQMGVWGFVKS